MGNPPAGRVAGRSKAQRKVDDELSLVVKVRGKLWEARHLILIVITMLGVSALAWTRGAEWFEATYPVSTDPKLEHAERAALVVCAISIVAFFIALMNVVKVWRTGEGLRIYIPTWFNTWLAKIVAVSVGILIGTTIFT